MASASVAMQDWILRTTPGTRAAVPGGTVVLYGSGFAASPAGALIASAIPLPGVTATIGGINASVLFAGVTAPGLFQVNITVPAGLASGDQPIVLTVAGASSPDKVILPVARRLCQPRAFSGLTYTAW